MSDLISSENLNESVLKETLDAAFVDADVDAEGDICVNDAEGARQNPVKREFQRQG